MFIQVRLWWLCERTSPLPLCLNVCVCVCQSFGLGCVLCVSEPKVEEKTWFVRDVSAYIIITAIIVTVGVSGEVSARR